MKTLLAATVIAAVAIAAPASAQNNAHKGGYLHLRGGLADLNNPNLTFVDDATDPDITIHAKTGTKSAAALSGEAGYDFGDLRLGLELGFSPNKVKSLTLNRVNGTTITPALIDAVLESDLGLGFDDDLPDGFALNGTTIRATKGAIAKMRQLAIMANVSYDVPVEGAIQPYIGGGLGAVSNRLTGFGETDTDLRFAWQVRAGVAFHVSDLFALTADYSYRATNKSSFTFADEEAFRFGSVKASLVQVGLRADF